MSERLQAEGQDLQLFCDECLGSGSYGKVCKAKLNELPCAAKLLHIILFQFEDPRGQTIQRRFEQECDILKNMRHPNVVQYLGVTHDPQSGLPILLMELLDGNLTNFLEHSDGPIPYHLQVNLWHDIALALTYLHSRHIIHRDLSGNNVLLIAGSRAKVTDFGMSKLSVVDANMSRLTQCPGTPHYMSPEALRTPPIYTDKLDVFSSGVVAIQIITRNYPDPGPDMLEVEDPTAPTGIMFAPIPEIERRRNHVDLIDLKHPMLPLIESCLKDRERERPSAQQLCHQLVLLKQAPEYTQSKQQPTQQERRIQEQEQLIQEQHKNIQDQKREQQRAAQEMQTEFERFERQTLELERKVEEHKRQIYEQQQQARNQQQQLQEQQNKNQQMQTQITKSEKDVQVLNTRLRENSQELQSKKQELRSKKQELWRAQYNLQQKTEELEQKTEELQQKTDEFQHTREELQGQLQQALQDQGLEELQVRITELETKLKENQDQRRLMEQLPPVFVERFTAEELPQHLKKLIEEGFQEWEDNLCKFRLFCGHPSSGDLMERKLEVHKNMTLGEVTERAYQVLELEQCGVQLEQCQLVRYNERSGTLGKPFDEPKETPLGEVVGDPQSSSFDLFMEIQTDPATLPQHEQRMRAARVIRTNYSLLWQHLDASKVLPKLVDKSVISEAKKKEVESYHQSRGQNAVIINALFTVEHIPEGLLTICDVLQTTTGKERIAQHILRDYRQQPLAVRVLHSLATGNAPLFSDVSLQFQNLERAVVNLLVQCPDALTQLKQCLTSLVLPLGDDKVASLVDPGSYEAANTIPEFFRLMAPHWNCLSTNLLSLLLEASGCRPAAAKLAEFEEARASSGPLVLCTQTASTCELRSVHSLPLEQLQSLHPAVFAESRAAAEQNTARITAKVDKPMLHVSCFEEVTTAICGFFRLPKAALVYGGCSENPLALCWLVSRDLLPYMRSHKGGLSGERLLAEQQITQIAFGDTESYRCLNLKEVELLEASLYGLLEGIPVLLTSVSVDAAGADGRTPLYTASLDGHQRVVELLLAAGANPDIQEETGLTALYIASFKGHDQTVELLLKREADVNHQIKDGSTPLQAASFDGHQRVVELLLAAGANPDIQEENGFAALHNACQEGHYQVAELLLQARASVEQETKNGRTALYIASWKGHDQIVERLLRREANVNHQTKSGRTPLWTVSFDGHQRVVEFLLAAGANPDIQEEDGFAPLHVACQEGHYQVAELLLEAGASVEQETKDGQTALYIACKKGHDQIVELLLRREADVNHQIKDGETPLWTTSFNGHQRVVELLLAAGANPDIQAEDGSTALHATCHEGHYQVTELLLQAGASVEQETKDGQTAVYIASDKGHDQIVELLLRREADVNHQIKDGSTPLWTASFDGHQRVVELLLAAGANPDIQAEDGFAPLHVACQEGHYQVAELLLEAGASVEQETKTGQTALFIGCKKGHDQIVELLLRREANVNHQTKFGQTPLTVARSQGHDHIVQLLREANRQRTATKSPATPPPKTPTAQSPPGMSRLFKFWKS